MAMKIFRPNRGTKTYAEEQGTVLHDGEMFFELPESGLGTGECKIKMGDGSTSYASLPYAIDLSTRAPLNHASDDTTYGGGNESEYGHVKLTDTYTVSGGGASDSVAASSLALFNAYTELTNNIKSNSDDITQLKSDLTELDTDVSSLLIIEQVSYVMADEKAIGGEYSWNMSIAKSGYTPLGILGWRATGNSYTRAIHTVMYISGTTLYDAIRNLTADGNNITSSWTYYYYILYMKNV